LDTNSVTRNSNTYNDTTSRVSSAKSTINTQKALAQLGQCSSTYKSSAGGSKNSVDTNKVLENIRKDGIRRSKRTREHNWIFDWIGLFLKNKLIRFLYFN